MFFMTQVLCQTLRSVLLFRQAGPEQLYAALKYTGSSHESEECLQVTHAILLLFNPNDAFLDTPQYPLEDVSEAAPKHSVPNELYR